MNPTSGAIAAENSSPTTLNRGICRTMIEKMTSTIKAM
jgi:hypothetical protein